MHQNTEIYHKLLAHFDSDNQLLKTVEECCELSVALMHYRDKKVCKDTVIGELADVAIMVEQLKIFFGPELVEKQISKKLEKVLPALDASCGDKQQDPENHGKLDELKNLIGELVSLCVLEENRFQESPQYDWETILPRAEKCLFQIKGLLYGGQLFTKQAQVADALLRLSCCSNKETYRGNLILPLINEVRSVLEHMLTELQQ